MAVSTAIHWRTYYSRPRFSDLETEIRVLHVLGTVQGMPLNRVPTRSRCTAGTTNRMEAIRRPEKNPPPFLAQCLKFDFHSLFGRPLSSELRPHQNPPALSAPCVPGGAIPFSGAFLVEIFLKVIHSAWIGLIVPPGSQASSKGENWLENSNYRSVKCTLNAT